MVRTGTRILEKGHGDCRNNRRNNLIVNKYSFEGKIKDRPLSKLVITKIGHQPTQYKKIVDTLSVLCADKNYWGIDDVIWTGNDLVEGDFMPTYSKANQWSSTHHVKISTVNLADPKAADDLHPPTFETLVQTYVFDANLQKELLLAYKRNSKNKSQDYSKFLVDKKALITIIFGQCDKATKTKIALGATYAADHQAGRLIKFLKQLCTVCFGSDDCGLSYAPYKQVVTVKSLNNFSNKKPRFPHGYKEKAKIKYDSVKAIAGKFSYWNSCDDEITCSGSTTTRLGLLLWANF